MREELAVQLDLHKAAAVDSDAPRLLPTARKGGKQVVAVVRHWRGWVVDPIIQNVQKAVGVVNVSVCKSADCRRYMIPLTSAKLSIADVVVWCLRDDDWIAAERIIIVDDGTRK